MAYYSPDMKLVAELHALIEDPIMDIAEFKNKLNELKERSTAIPEFTSSMFSIPFLNKYGKRKSWIISMQILIIFGLFALSITNPASDLKFFACIAFFIALCGSFNDIAVDAFRIELAEIEEQASLAAGYQLGYRAAILLASSGALIIASRTSWEFVYQAMSLIMIFGIIGSLIVKENDNPSLVKLSILNSFWMPLKDFYKRFGLYLASLLLLIISILFVLTIFLLSYILLFRFLSLT